MKGYIITGTSSGIGKSLVDILLESPENRILGICRNQTIKHENYRHIAIDLNQIDEIDTIDLPEWKDLNQITLVHNAGSVGPIQKMGNQELRSIASVYSINLIAPAVLSNLFIAKYRSYSAQKVILSIGSGASKNPIAGWGSYCSSKSGLDMLSKCISLEHPEIICLSIAPGKVDTPMQNDIRCADETEFPRLKEFQQYFKDGKLISSRNVAEKFNMILKNPLNYLKIDRISQI
tara:strand:- start:1270 stop:1971 length:702 start_codon:yes stop_codon:yes gene_type:complete